MKRYIKQSVSVLFSFLILFSAGHFLLGNNTDSVALPKEKTIVVTVEDRINLSGSNATTSQRKNVSFNLKDIPEYFGNPYVEVNDNMPYFTDDEMKQGIVSWSSFDDLDALGRCGECFASIGIDLMPSVNRGSIGKIKPSGWQQVKYPDLIDGNYLYNKCHLIGYQLSGENANEKNLITGTRYMNVDGMLPFEDKVANYVNESSNHVLYRVTPVFENRNLIASGVLMEGKSVEDNGEGINFCVYAYNVQPGVDIDYTTGDSLANNSKLSKYYGSSVKGGAKKLQPVPKKKTEEAADKKVSKSASSDSSKKSEPAPAPKQEAESAPSPAPAPAPQQEVAPEPAPQPEPAPAPAPAGGTVWISKSGKKYHSNPSCSNMKNPSQVSQAEAEAMGRGPCSKCY